MIKKIAIFKRVRIYSIHKNHVLTLAVPNDSLKDYYNNVRLNYTKTLEPILEKKQRETNMQKALDRMNDDDYFETMEYLKGNRKKH